MGLNRDLLENKELLIRYPLLNNDDVDVLYRKALALLRWVSDLVLSLYHLQC